MSSSKPPPPDPAQQELARAQAESARLYTGLAREQFNEALGFAKSEAARGDEQYRFNRGLQEEAASRDRFFFDRYKDTTMRNEDKFFESVENFDTNAERERLANAGMADVEMQTAAARQGTARGLAARNVNPGSTRSISAMAGLDYQGAMGKASAANVAREAARREGMSLRATAAGMGNPLGASTGYMGASSDFGRTALGTGATGFNNASGLFANASGSGHNAAGAANSMFNSIGQQHANRANAGVNWGQVAAQGLATYGGYMMAAGSDRRLKTDIVPVGRMENGLTVYRYRYKAGGPYVIGVMADEVERVIPHAVLKGVVPGGFDAVNYAAL